MIPIQLYEDERIEPNDRDVYGVVYWYEHLKDGECTASNSSIAAVINGTSTRAVQNSLSKLEDLGYISREYKDRAKRNRVRIRTNIAFRYIRPKKRSNEVVVTPERSGGDRANEVVVTRVRIVEKNRKKNYAADSKSAGIRVHTKGMTHIGQLIKQRS